MAKARRLKVFRTPIGFHDAYVAAPSRKAALQAWGSDADLFARGVAEEVTDEALMREPLEQPGTIVRRLRGTAEEQFAALPPDTPKRKRAAPSSSDSTFAPRHRKRVDKDAGTARTRPALMPQPSRDRLDEAERSLEALLAAQAGEVKALVAREKALARERRDLERAQAKMRDAAERQVGRLREDHADALRRWREDQG